MKTFGSGKKYLSTERMARAVAAQKAVEWLVEEGHIPASRLSSDLRKRKGDATPGSFGSASCPRSEEPPSKRVHHDGDRDRSRSRSPHRDRTRRRSRERSRDRSRERDRSRDRRERERERERPRSRDRARSRDRELDRERERNDRYGDHYNGDSAAYTNRRDTDRYARERERHRHDGVRRQVERARDFGKVPDRASSKMPVAFTAPLSASEGKAFDGHAIDVKVGKLTSIASGTSLISNEYEAKISRLAPVLGFAQPIVYIMPADPIRCPNSNFSGSVHFPGHAVDGEEGAAVVFMKELPVEGHEAARRYFYKQALQWLENQQQDREKALEEQLKQLRELRAFKGGIDTD